MQPHHHIPVSARLWEEPHATRTTRMDRNARCTKKTRTIFGVRRTSLPSIKLVGPISTSTRLVLCNGSSYTDTRRPHAKAASITWRGNPERMYFYDGCALIGDTNKFQIVATYANGDAMAIQQNNIGLIGCHPESEKFWYESYSWMRGRYHSDKHHKLLLEFVDQLMQNQ